MKSLFRKAGRKRDFSAPKTRGGPAVLVTAFLEMTGCDIVELQVETVRNTNTFPAIDVLPPCG
jgi:hypothetical protein